MAILVPIVEEPLRLRDLRSGDYFRFLPGLKGDTLTSHERNPDGSWWMACRDDHSMHRLCVRDDGSWIRASLRAPVAVAGECETETLEGPYDRCNLEADFECLSCLQQKCDGCMSGGMLLICLECSERFREAGLKLVDDDTDQIL